MFVVVQLDDYHLEKKALARAEIIVTLRGEFIFLFCILPVAINDDVDHRENNGPMSFILGLQSVVKKKSSFCFLVEEFLFVMDWSTAFSLGIEQNRSSTVSDECLDGVALFLRYAGTFVVIFGLIGNILSMIVFTRKRLRFRSCSMYFLALSVSDICVLVGYTFESLLFHAYGIQLLSKSISCKLIIFSIYASTDVSNYFLTLAAIDRCVLISNQATHHRFCQRSVAKYLIIFVICFFCLINGHVLYGFRVDQNGSCLPSSTPYVEFYFNYYDSYIDIVKTVLIPFLLIFGCNIFIVYHLSRKRFSLKRNSSTTGRNRRRRQEKERQLTGFLLFTSILFIIFSLPSEINDFLRTKLTDQFQRKYTCQLWTLTSILILLHQLNHASHFYVYTLTGPIFRREFRNLFRSSENKRASIITRLTQRDGSEARRSSSLTPKTVPTLTRIELTLTPLQETESLC